MWRRFTDLSPPKVAVFRLPMGIKSLPEYIFVVVMLPIDMCRQLMYVSLFWLVFFRVSVGCIITSSNLHTSTHDQVYKSCMAGPTRKLIYGFPVVYLNTRKICYFFCSCQLFEVLNFLKFRNLSSSCLFIENGEKTLISASNICNIRFEHNWHRVGLQSDSNQRFTTHDSMCTSY